MWNHIIHKEVRGKHDDIIQIKYIEKHQNSRSCYGKSSSILLNKMLENDRLNIGKYTWKLKIHMMEFGYFFSKN